jgi:hypothetical protein
VTSEVTSVRFGAQQVAVTIQQFDHVDEARAELGDGALLALINRAYRLQQLTARRRELERHPRVKE